MDRAVVLGLLGCGLLLAAGTGAAVLLRAARCPGASVVGGVLAGVLLGPTIFGRVLPTPYESAFVGGVEQRSLRDRLLHEQDRDLKAAEFAGADPDVIAAIRADRGREIELATATWTDARWAHQRPLRVFALIVVGATLLAGGSAAAGRGQGRPSLGSTMSIGAWAAAVPGVTVYLVLHHLLQVAAAQAALVAAAVAIGPYALTEVDRQIADDAEFGGARLIRAAGGISSVLAISLAMGAVAASGGAARLLFALPLLLLAVGWLVPRQKSLEALRERVLVPTLAASVAIKIELYEHAAVWPILTLLVVSGDGRWVGATIGGLIPGGRRWLRTMRLVMGCMAAGPPQLAVAAVGLHGGMIGEPLALAVVVGALVIEVTTPVRRAVARRLSETEEEIETL